MKAYVFALLTVIFILFIVVNAQAVSHCEFPLLSVPLTFLFKTAYGVDLTECERPSVLDYSSLNDFFTRSIKPRTIENGIVSPVDGKIGQQGKIQGGTLLQAKGRYYHVNDLVHEHLAQDLLEGGTFMTIYLAPYNYHRVHMPVTGTLIASKRIVGRSLPVNALAINNVNGVFSQNERHVLLFRLKNGSLLFVVFVGALFVDSIDVVSDFRMYGKGEEIGKFNFGSTVILLFEDRIRMSRKNTVKMGYSLL